MPQEVRLGRLAQILEAVLAISSWTPWLVRTKPVQIETLHISITRITLIRLAFVGWTVEGPMCVITHRDDKRTSV
jgi:hypothetical protein